MEPEEMSAEELPKNQIWFVNRAGQVVGKILNVELAAMNPEEMSLEELLAPCREFVSGPVWSTPKSEEMARRLRLLGERHQQIESDHKGAPYTYCACGHSKPCPDAEILEGKR